MTVKPFPAISPVTRKPMDHIDLLEAVLRERPDLRGQPVVSSPQGSLSHVFFIGDEAFKGPEDTFSIPDIRKEVTLLHQLKDADLPIPRLTCVGRDAVFMGMTRMKGEPLYKHSRALSAGQWGRLMKSLADAILCMAKMLPKNDKEDFFLHSDLSPGNILVDPETKRLTGVIDFGFVDYAPAMCLGTAPIMPKEGLSYLCNRFFMRRIGELTQNQNVLRMEQSP